MPFEQKDNSGTLFNNADQKEKDSHPDYKGSALIDGVAYWVSGWVNKPKGGGAAYLSLKFTAKDEQQAKNREEPADEDDPVLPF